MSTLAAVRCNPVIRAFYLHLRAAGEPARWAVRGFTKALQADLANTGIGVTLYESGVVQSEYWDHNPGSRERVPKMGTLGPTLTAEAAGRAIVRGITREQIVPEDENPWESRVLLEPVGSHAFRMVSPGFTTGAIGELLTFEMDAAGKAVRVRTPYFYWLPIREDTRATR